MPSYCCSSTDMVSSTFKGEIFILTGYLALMVMRICETLKLLELLLAMNALPKHMASSPFKCTLIFLPGSLCSKASTTFGVLTPPPISSTRSISSAVRPAAASASSIGYPILAKM